MTQLRRWLKGNSMASGSVATSLEQLQEEAKQLKGENETSADGAKIPEKTFALFAKESF